LVPIIIRLAFSWATKWFTPFTKELEIITGLTMVLVLERLRGTKNRE
jgi:hypothetical protein